MELPARAHTFSLVGPTFFTSVPSHVPLAGHRDGIGVERLSLRRGCGWAAGELRDGLAGELLLVLGEIAERFLLEYTALVRHVGWCGGRKGLISKEKLTREPLQVG